MENIPISVRCVSSEVLVLYSGPASFRNPVGAFPFCSDASVSRAICWKTVSHISAKDCVPR